MWWWIACTKDPATAPGDDDDTDTDTTPVVDLTGDTAFTPPEIDTFAPFNVYVTAYFGWDAETGVGGSYLWDNGAVIPPQLAVTVYTAGFLLDGDHTTGACGMVVTYETANGPLVPEAWTFEQDGTAHTHLGFRLPAGTFTVDDLPDADRGLLGCSRHEFDAERFPYGLIQAARERDWGVGFGTIDAALVADVASDPDYAGTQALLDADQVVGGAMLTRQDPPYDARWFTRGYALGADGRILLGTPLTADQMSGRTPPSGGDTAADTASADTASADTASTDTASTDTASTDTASTDTAAPPGPGLPVTGAYSWFAPNWVSFSSFW